MTMTTTMMKMVWRVHHTVVPNWFDLGCAHRRLRDRGANVEGDYAAERRECEG